MIIESGLLLFLLSLHECYSLPHIVGLSQWVLLLFGGTQINGPIFCSLAKFPLV